MKSLIATMVACLLLVGSIGCSSSRVVIPQADPNGLFMPDGLSATWLLLKGPDGKVQPVYVEPQIIVSPFKLHVTKQESSPPV